MLHEERRAALGKGLAVLSVGRSLWSADRVGRCRGQRSAVHGIAGTVSVHSAGDIAATVAVAMGAGCRPLHPAGGICGILSVDGEAIPGPSLWIIFGVSAGVCGGVWRLPHARSV